MHNLGGSNPLNIKLSFAEGDGGLPICTGATQDALQLTQALANKEIQSQIVTWINDIGYPIIIDVGDEVSPELRMHNTPNRGNDAEENTEGQPLLLGDLATLREIVIRQLQKTNSNLRQILNAVENSDTEQANRIALHAKALLIGEEMIDCPPLTLLMLRLAKTKMFDAVLRETQRITKDIPHARHHWEEERGKLLLVPEGKIVHRREGAKGVQVVWHTDSGSNAVLGFHMPQNGNVPRKFFLRDWVRQDLNYF